MRRSVLRYGLLIPPRWSIIQPMAMNLPTRPTQDEPCVRDSRQGCRIDLLQVGDRRGSSTSQHVGMTPGQVRIAPVESRSRVFSAGRAYRRSFIAQLQCPNAKSMRLARESSPRTQRENRDPRMVRMLHVPMYRRAYPRAGAQPGVRRRREWGHSASVTCDASAVRDSR